MRWSAAVRNVRVAIAAIAIVSTAAPALAQRPVPEREREKLGIIVSASGASTRQDLNQPEEVTEDIPELRSTMFADLEGLMRYQPDPFGKVVLSVTASSAVRRYQGGDEFVLLGHSAGATATINPTGRTSVSTTGSFSYVPAYSINATPSGDLGSLADAAGTLPPNAVDYALTKRVLFGSYGGVSLDQGLTRRLKLGMWYAASRQEFALDIDPSYISHNMAGRLTYSLTRGLAVRAGFGRRLTDFQTPDGVEQVAIDDIDVGLVFTESVGITRTTRFTFSTGSSINSEEGDRQAYLTGSASLIQELGRRGELALSFNRGSDLTPGFGRPVFSNSLSLTGNYNLTKALNASFISFASFGQSGRSASGDNKVESMSGSARLGYAVARNLEAYAEYLAYRSYIDQGVILVASVPRDRTSQSIRFGIALSIPLVTGPLPRDLTRPAPERN